MKIKTKLIVIMLIICVIINIIMPVIKAFSINEANIKREYHTEQHLRYWDNNLNDWYYVGATIVKYTAPNGNKYPAYCINRELPGVGIGTGEYENYDVTIADVISNEQIWRVIKNGYPYKSAEELGLQTEEDAFLATKQAVYCILADRNPSTFYISADDIEHGGADERGDKIKNAIVSLVNNARNSNEIYSKGEFTITKTEAKEDTLNKKYISSTYTLNSNFNVKKFIISIQDKIPDGTIITDINNVEKDIFSAGEKFKILVPKTSIGNVWNDDGLNWTSDNISFNVNVKAELKTYPVLYGKTTIEGTQNYALTGEAFEIEESSTNFEYNTKGGKTVISKISADNNYWTNDEKGQKLSNAKYELKRKDTNKTIKILETDSEGKIEITGLPQGEYTLQEVESPNYYVKDTKIHTFKITEDMQLLNFKLENSPIVCGFLNVSKTSNNYSILQNKENDSYLAGAKYEIKDSSEKLIYSGVTNESGKFDENLKLEPGEYTIYETEAPEGYILDKTIYKFVISEINGETTIINLKNDVLEYKQEEPQKPIKKMSPPKLPKTGY